MVPDFVVGGTLAVRSESPLTLHVEDTCSAKAGVSEAERVGPHVLRQAPVTDLLRQTKNIRLVQKALGHSDLSTTMIYAHVFDEELEEAMRGQT